MSIENISRIYEKKNNYSYVFDIPSINDNDATDSYILRNQDNNSYLSKITDFGVFMYQLKTLKAKEIDIDSKECKKFLKILKEYILSYKYNQLLEEKNDDNISEEDIKNIAFHYKELFLEIKKK